LLRRLPLFVIPGDGSYRLQPIYVEDFAKLLADAGGSTEDTTFDAVGPETYRFEELVELVRGAVGSRARLVHAPAPVAPLPARSAPAPAAAAPALGRTVGRVVPGGLTRPDELEGLADDLPVSAQPPPGTTSFRGWVHDHAPALGRVSASELARHYRR